MRVRVSLLAAVSAALLSSAHAATSLDAGTFKQLVQLEQKFFGRTYDSDTDEIRTDRLEKLIFGSQNAGDPGKRIKQIVSATSSEDVPEVSGDLPADLEPTPGKPGQKNPTAPATAPSTAHNSTTTAHSKSGSGTGNAPAQAPAPAPSIAAKKPAAPANSTAVASDPYPHIEALEDALFSKTFSGQSPSVRLSRLEVKAFGKASSSPDLSDRTDALEDYVEKTLHKKPFGQDPEGESDDADDQNGAAGSGSPAASAPATAPARHSAAAHNGAGMAEAAPAGDQADYPHITALENTILGTAYPGQPLTDRLARMETKAFGSTSTDPDLSDRTDNLETYAEKKLHKKPEAIAEQSEDGPDDGSATHRQGDGSKSRLLSMVGNTLMGMAGVGPNAFGPGGFGGPGMGGMGFGGPGSVGFAGARIRKRSDVQQQQAQEEEPKKVEPVEDPAVYGAVPPPAGAKLITQVGWCEVQLFGHTSPNLHLTERLSLLNAELNFAPGQKGMELMDDSDAMMKKAIAKAPKHAGPGQGTGQNPTIGAKPAAAPH